MAYKQSVKFENLRSINSAAFTGVYQPLGTPLSNPSILIKIVNASTVPVTISTDGINDMDIVSDSNFFLYDIGSNSPRISTGTFFAAGTQFLVKGEAGTGSVHLTTLYVEQV